MSEAAIVVWEPSEEFCDALQTFITSDIPEAQVESDAGNADATGCDGTPCKDEELFHGIVGYAPITETTMMVHLENALVALRAVMDSANFDNICALIATLNFELGPLVAVLCQSCNLRNGLI